VYRLYRPILLTCSDGSGVRDPCPVLITPVVMNRQEAIRPGDEYRGCMHYHCDPGCAS
jgi:hypothetical protein